MGDKPRILIIDDSRSLVLSVFRIFQEEGFEVLTAFDGLEGLKKAREEHPDLIILDIVMPKLDGFQFLDLLRQYSSIPVVVFTGVHDENKLNKALTLGANGYVMKPVPIRELALEIKSKLGHTVTRVQ